MIQEEISCLALEGQARSVHSQKVSRKNTSGILKTKQSIQPSAAQQSLQRKVSPPSLFMSRNTDELCVRNTEKKLSSNTVFMLCAAF